MLSHSPVKPNPFINSRIVPILTFSWVTDLLSSTKGSSFEQTDHPELTPYQDINVSSQNHRHYFSKFSSSLSIAFSIFPSKWIFVLTQLFYALLELLHVAIMFLFTRYVSSIPDGEFTDRYVIMRYLLLIMLMSFVKMVLDVISEFYFNYNTISVTNNFEIAIIRKILDIRIGFDSITAKGNLLNLIQTDCQAFSEYTSALAKIFYVMTSISMIFLIGFYIVSWTFGVYIFSIVVGVLISSFALNKKAKLQAKLYQLKDERMGLILSILSNIRFIKFNVLENFFISFLTSKREREIVILKKIIVVTLLFYLMLWTSPGISSSLFLWTYISYFGILRPDTFMAIQKMFVFINEFTFIFPNIVGSVISLLISTKRIDKFLAINTSEFSYVEKMTKGSEKYALSVKGSFSYNNSEEQNFNKQFQKIDHEESIEMIENPLIHFSLKNIDLKFKKNELVFVIGRIGSGKTSFLKAILGEMRPENQAQVFTEGMISYCPQTPFISNKTVRENVVFYSEVDEQRLQWAYNLSELTDDFKSQLSESKILTDGGSNISGGQRMRINIARSIYSKSEIFLFDDPFSSLDLNVTSKVFEKCILKGLEGKLRIVATHSLQFLELGNRVIFIDDGNILFNGSYIDFRRSNYYSNFVQSTKKENDKLRSSQQDHGHTFINHGLKPISENADDQADDSFIAEDREKDRAFIQNVYRIFKHFGGFKIIFMVYIFVQIALIFSYYSMKYLLDFFTHPEESRVYHHLIMFTLMRTVPHIFCALRNTVSSYFSVLASRRIFRTMIFKSVHADLLGFLDRIELGRLINRFSKDLSNVDFHVMDRISTFSYCISSVLFDIVIICSNVSFMALTFCIAYIYIVIRFHKYYITAKKNITRLSSVSKSPIVNITSEIVNGRSIFKSLQKEEEVTRELGTLINENSKNKILDAALESWFSIRVSFLNIFIVQFISMIFICFIFIKSLNANEISLYVFYVSNMIINIFDFLQLLSLVETSLVSLERCDAFENIDPEPNYKNLDRTEEFLIQNEEKSPGFFAFNKILELQNRQFTYEEINSFNFKGTLFRKGRIEFRNVNARYSAKAALALKDFNLIIEPGSKVGICGKTGSGKSTVVKVLCHYLPVESGEVLIDGYDISRIDLKVLRSEFAIVSQEITLFEGTLRENLMPSLKSSKDSPGKEDKPDTKTNQQSHLKESLLIETNSSLKDSQILLELASIGFKSDTLQKQGLEFWINADGSNLSQGEKQLIAFFRAILSEKQIVILDEATSSIDIETENKLLDFFFSKSIGKTIIKIAHRINTIRKSDMIVVMKAGQIAEKGSFAELSQHQGSILKQYADHAK